MAERRDRLVSRLAAMPPGRPLDLICQTAVELLAVQGGAVILMSADESGAVAASYGPGVAAVEDLQFTLGEGPCAAAFRDGISVLEPDIGDAGLRWPAFAPAAVDAGARAVFALPLQLGAIRVGVLYLVRDRTGALSDEALATAHDLAQLATVTVLDSEQGGPGRYVGAGADDNWAHRAVVHQATGMVAVQLDVGLGTALARLRARAYATERSIYDIAVDVVGRRICMCEDGGPDGS